MREIKFRQWNENDVFSSNKMDYNPVLEYSTGMATMAVDINWLMKKHQSNLMQYTGLKDKNGTEIYEGDILKHRSVVNDPEGKILHEIVAEVVIDKGMTYVNGHINYGFFDEGIEVYEHRALLLHSHGLFEVVGNIYEHKHLLEESK